MEKFIYVFTKEARDKMQSAGCKLLKEDQGVYIFLNEGRLNFAELDVSYILSNNLTL